MSKKNGTGKQQSVLLSQVEIGKLLETVPVSYTHLTLPTNREV